MTPQDPDTVVEALLVGWIVFVVCGCATTPHVVGSKQLTRETWALAESREHWPDLTGDPEADLVNLALQVQELGGHIETWDDRSRVTCHDRTIHLRAGWNLSGDAYAARKLAHEVVHLAQMVEVGCAEFRRVYLDAGGRAYLELQAGGVESFGFVLYQEGTPAEHEIWVVRKVTRMYDDPAIGGGGYVLGTVDRDHWLRYAAETLRRAAR